MKFLTGYEDKNNCRRLCCYSYCFRKRHPGPYRIRHVPYKIRELILNALYSEKLGIPVNEIRNCCYEERYEYHVSKKGCIPEKQANPNKDYADY